MRLLIKEIRLSGHMAVVVQVDALEAMKALAAEKGGPGLVMLNVDSLTETIGLVPSNARPPSISELRQTISANEPRFTFYRFEHEHAGHKSSPFLFFFTCPAPSGVQATRSRMLYPLMKRAAIEIAEQECGLVAEKRFEMEDLTELTENLVLEELYPSEGVQDVTKPA
ncbi:hypothetical protein DL765_004271 [Monosporascus sp. GIB2]|nr:hypothetical protein DL765_004271 [Monosporascus sp. GIB2]